MKINPMNRVLAAVLGTFSVLSLPVASHAASGVWTNLLGGSWATSANWTNSVMASGSGNTADFSQLTLGAAPTVTLDGAQTIGSLIFGDLGNTYGWTLNTGSGGPLTLAVSSGSPTITVNGQTNTIGLVLAGAQGLTKAGAGMLVVTNVNTYAGPTTINAGALTVAGAGTLGGGTYAGLITNNGVLNCNSSASQTLSGAISGTGSLNKNNSGTLTLSGVNTYSGPTTVTNGTVNVTGNESGATGSWLMPLNYAASTVNFQAGSTVVVASANGVQVGSSPAAGTPNNQTLNVAGNVTNNGSLLVARGGVLNINSGGVWVQAGNMSNSPPSASGYGASVTIASGGSFNYTGANPILLCGSSGSSGSGLLTIGGGTFTTGQGFTNIPTGSTGYGQIILTNNGSLVLSANVPELTSGTNTGTTAAISLGVGGGAINTAGYATTITNVIGGSGSLTILGGGTVTLGAINTLSGSTIINGGTLALTGSGSLASSPAILVGPSGLFNVSGLSSAFVLGSGQSLTAGNTGTVVTNVNGNFSSGGTINVAGTGTNGTLTINGNLSLTGGTLLYDSSDLISLSGASPTLTLSGTTTLQPSVGLSDGTYTLINNISSIAGGTAANLALAGGAPRGATATFTVAAPAVTLNISGTSPGSLTWQGTNGANWDLSTINWLNTGTSLADRFYSLDSVAFDDTGRSAVSLVGTLYPSSITISSVNTNNTFSGSGSIAGAATLLLNGSSTTTIGTANSFSGGTTINSGTLKLANGSALGNGTGPLTMGGGILDLNSNNLSVQTLSGTGGIITNTYVTATANNMTLTVNQISSNSFSGLIQNSTGNTTNYIALVKNGPGYLLLSGASTYGKAGSGATVNAGTLEATNKAATGNYQGDYVLAQGATLKLGYNTTTSYNYGNGVTVNGTSASDPSGLYLLAGKSLGFGDGIVLQTAPSTVRAYGSGTATILGGDVNNTHLTLNAAASGSVIAPAVNINANSYGYRMNIASGANNASGDLLIDGVISGGPGSSYVQNGQSVHLDKEGAGSLLLTNVSTYTDGLWLKNGKVMLSGGNNRLPAGSGIALGDGGSNSGILQLNGVGQTFTNVITYGTGTANAVVGGSATTSTLTINNAVADTYTGIIGGTGVNQNNLGLVKTGAGLLTLSGQLLYTGSTTISAGTVLAGSLTNADGATLSVPDVAGTLAATNLALGVSSGSTVAITSFAGAASAPIVVTNLSTAGTVYVSLAGT